VCKSDWQHSSIINITHWDTTLQTNITSPLHSIIYNYKFINSIITGQIFMTSVNILLFKASPKSHFLLIPMLQIRKVMRWNDDTITHDPVQLCDNNTLDVIDLEDNLLWKLLNAWNNQIMSNKRWWLYEHYATWHKNRILHCNFLRLLTTKCCDICLHTM
jgi:hypothetical protein